MVEGNVKKTSHVSNCVYFNNSLNILIKYVRVKY